jgi:rhamnose transport system permease protein
MSVQPLGTGAAPRYAVADRPPLALSDVLLRWETLLAVLLVLVVVINAWASPYFLDFYNLSDSTANFSEKAIIALAMALLIIAREIDLSVAAIIALASLAMGHAASLGAGPAVLIPLGLLVGLLCGVVNGALVTRFNLPSIVVTIGTMSLFRGIASVVLGDKAYTKYPAGFLSIGQDYAASWLKFPLSFVLFLLLAAVAALVLHAMPAGRKIMALGNNPVAARFSGVPVDRIRFTLFVVSGLAAGLAAVLLTARIGSTRPNIALGFELEAVTIVVLGGVSILGGSGTIGGVVLAAFVLGLAQFGMGLMNVPGVVMSVLIGLLLIAAIALPIVVRRLMGRRPTA